MRSTSAAYLTFVAAFVAGHPSAAEVTIEQKPVVVEQRIFDSAHRPGEMPPLKPGEAAVTESHFVCDTDLSYKVLDRTPGEAGCTTSVRIQSVHMTLSLRILIWLPTAAPPKLVAHEQGHQHIDQRIYKEARQIAETEAKLLDGQVKTTSAADCAAAEKKATQSAAEELGKRYLQAVGHRAELINGRYDEITLHGTKTAPAEDKAIEQAFDCERPAR
jgi:hypothetical protein